MNVSAAFSATANSIPSSYRLRMPGPAAIPERVRATVALPVLSHRGVEFRAILEDVTGALRAVLGTRHHVFLLGASGTGGMEAALVNVLSAGDAVLVVENGQFGERFSSIAEGLPVDTRSPAGTVGRRAGRRDDRGAREGEALSRRRRHSQ